MRYALIDNSTLTAVQRLMGEIEIQNKHTIDGDIAALESLIQAILFYDKIVALDDYKEQYAQRRKTYFDQIMFFKPSRTTYDHLVSEAKAITESIVPCVEGGTFKDQDFKAFFEQLKMNVTFTWDMRSSVFYLTIKMLERVGGLDLPKYNKLTSMIFHELADKRLSQKPLDKSDFKLYDSRGNVITSDYVLSNREGKSLEIGGVSEQAKAFFAGLNWLSLRTALYTLAAKQLGTDLILHPIRNAFQVNLLSKMHNYNPSVFSPVLEAMNSSARDTLNKVLLNTQPLVIQQPLPMFSAWLANRTKDPHKFIEEAYALRYKPEFVQARSQLIELEGLLQTGNKGPAYATEVNKLVQGVREQLNRILVRYNVVVPKGSSLSWPIFVLNAALMAMGIPQVPSIDKDIKQLDSFRDALPVKGFKAVYRNITQELTEISQLSQYHDIITSKVLLHKDASFFDIKPEKVKYSKMESYWKVPM